MGRGLPKVFETNLLHCHFVLMSQEQLTAFPLRSARVHEVCGPAALTFAAIAAALAGARVLWVRACRFRDTVYPPGLVPFLDPSHLLLARAETHRDTLGVAEESLRSGALPFTVIEIGQPLDLREGRRLQLAAKAGGTTGLCIIPQGMGSNAAETRWHAAPVFDPHSEDSTLMRWEIIKNKTGTLEAWNVRWDPETRRLHVVPPAGERPGPEGASG
jgi:protein ImuA